MKSQSRILPFNQPGAFFHKRARKQMDKSRHLDALQSLRRAVLGEPGNVEFVLDLAETYTEMGCFEESNRVLFGLMRGEEVISECYFGLGCNYMGLQDYEKAHGCFLTYMRLDPTGAYFQDVDDLIEAIEETNWESDGDVPINILNATRRGKAQLDSGEYEKAIRQFEKVLEFDSSLTHIRNNVSLAYFCMGRLDEAVENAKHTLDIDPEDLHANCNMAMYCHATNKHEEARRYAEKALALSFSDSDDAQKLCYAISELGMVEEAMPRVRALSRERPYDIKTLHHLASLCFNAGKRDEAETLWRRILLIQPENSVAQYYLSLPADTDVRVPFHFQVPHEEVLGRIRRINEMVKAGIPDMKTLWSTDAGFRSLVLWGLELTDAGIRRALYQLLAVFGDEAAVDALLNCLTRIGETDANKREALGALKQLRVPEPYIAVMDGALVEVRVNELSTGNHNSSAESVAGLAVAMCLKSMEERYDRRVVSLAAEVWDAFRHTPKAQLIRKPEAWAAALETAARRLCGLPSENAQTCAFWGASLSTLSKNVSALMDAYAERDFELDND